MTTLGERIGLARRRAELSQAQLGERLGAGRNAVSLWEKDERMPDSSYLLQLPDILGVTGDWLFWGKGEPYPKDPEESNIRLGIIERALSTDLRSLLRDEAARLARQEIERRISESEQHDPESHHLPSEPLGSGGDASPPRPPRAPKAGGSRQAGGQ